MRGRSVLRLLHQVSLREARRQCGRTALLAGAVSTGVALIVAVGVINASVLASFQRTFDSLAGPSDLEMVLGNGEVGFDESLVDAVRRDPEVAAAVPLVHGTVALSVDPSDALQLFGAELTAEDDLARYGVHLATARHDALATMEDPHGILLSTTVAERLGVGVGAKLELVTARGTDAFTVRGLVAPQGLAATLAGQLVVMDLAAAQTELAREGQVDQIDLVLVPGADVDGARKRLASSLPSGFSIGPPAARGARYADILHGLQATLGGMSLMCMVAGLFIIHNGISAWVRHIIPSLVGYDIPLLVPALGCIATATLVLVATMLAGRAAGARATRASILEGLRTD